VDDEDLLARVQQRGRLHGLNESRRAVCAVVEALGEFLSPRAFHLLIEQLPDDVRHRVRRSEVSVLAPTSRAFLAGIAARLFQDGPDATFTARIVLEELNATGRVITPARFAHLVAADLRPLLCARRAPVTADLDNPAPRRLIRVGPAPARLAAPARPATPARPAATARPATPGRPATPARPATPVAPAAATALTASGL
jgi:hypothetical protein